MTTKTTPKVAKKPASRAAKVSKTTKKITPTTEHRSAAQSGIAAFFHVHGHAVLAFLYAVQALVLLLVAKTTSVGITNSFIAQDVLTSNGTGHEVLASASRHFMDVTVVYVAAAALLLAAITHVSLSIIRKRDTWPKTMIIRHGRRVRWTGLTLSAATTVTLAALMLGLRDVAILVTLQALIGLAGTVGYMLEVHQSLSRRIVLLLSIFSIVVPILILGLTTLSGSLHGDLSTPLLFIALTLVLGIIGSYGAFYYVVIAKKPTSFNVAAFSSVVLFVIQTAVVWQVFAAFLRS